MAGSLASATCSPDTRRPTGSARAAGGSPRGREPMALSSFRRLSSSTGSPISSRRRESTGIACRLETSQGCLHRITDSGGRSRRWRSATCGKRPDATAGGHGGDGHDTGGCCDATHATQKPRSHDTSSKSLGETPGPGGGGVSTCVPHVRRRHPADRVHHGTGADPEDSHAPRRTTRAVTCLSRSSDRRPSAR